MNRALAALLMLLATATAQGQVARIAQWVEDAPATDNDKIALGYPVPIPVDTPLPFDGFRSYSGLHTRHQDLAATTPWVHPAAAGKTHAGRTIWAYRLGDADLLTRRGVPEPAMLTNGGIHAREWQSPETVTGIMELLVEQQGDHFLYSYLRDNVNVILVPVLNVDGFLQTQRYPESSWLSTDPSDPAAAPRDGRMRRKNMLLADEDLLSQDDHLNGVDLNRNNPPYWNTSPGDSSGDVQSLVHHGAAPGSEPEIDALDT
ncbi:MAG TPA: M14 family zinc carboxypeptidase, partial [Xanthomonadales bacterium]|nr:M14 family zinc carboxypeptidase [Xanthomonadales bacterium]